MSSWKAARNSRLSTSLRDSMSASRACRSSSAVRCRIAASAAARRSLTSRCSADPMRVGPGLRRDRHDAELDPEGGAVPAVVQQLDHQRLPAPDVVAQSVKGRAVGARPLQQARVSAADLVLRVAGHPGEGGIAVEDARPGPIRRIGVGDQDRVVGVHDDGLEQAQPLQRPVLLGAERRASAGRRSRTCRRSNGSRECDRSSSQPRRGDPLHADRDQLLQVRLMTRGTRSR